MGVETKLGVKTERTGMKKDDATGLQAIYNNLEPESIHIIMNGEVLNHTDVPPGEDFIILNKNIKGLTVKEGKVSVGCALRITDSAGKILLQEPDLFKNGGIYEAQKKMYLKCTVATGKPMHWEEKYNIQATFWDKWGDRLLVNKVTIRSIDMP